MKNVLDSEMWAYIDKLPGYMQHKLRTHIQYLERGLAEEKERLSKFQANEVSNVFIPHFRGDLSSNFNLPKDCSVRFVLGQNHYEWVECRIKEGRLYLMAGDSIMIMSDAANTCYIMPRDRVKEKGE